MVVVVDADIASQVLSNSEGLSKAMEPHLSDKLLSHRPGHRTLFSSDTNSPYWRLIRKGTAPAFKAENIKCAAPLCRPVCFANQQMLLTLLLA
jgi:cytochrome P450